MKTINALRSLMILASSLLFIQCTSDPVTIAGADGVDGADGTASCVACHSNTHRAPINAAYAISKHATGETFVRGSRGSCAECHSNEGFIDFVNLGAANEDGYDNPTRISCTTCHDKHGSFDFTNDGFDFALRTFAPVPLRHINPGYQIDLGDKSNTCVNCHQPRRADPTDDGTGLFEITSTHWGPHHGTQATVLEGMGGAHLTGSLSYPDVASATHRQGSSCVKCHMGETTDGNDGSHSKWVTENACVACHTNGVPSEVEGIAADLATLEGLLENVVGWEYEYLVDGNGELVLDANGDPIIVLDGNGDPVTLDVHGIIHDGHPNAGSFGEGATFTFVESQAAWNYLTVMEDRSEGVHNPAYAKALIRNSVEALD